MEQINGSKDAIVHDFQKGYLTLPFNQDQFQTFIKGLLGTPQTITKRIRGNFDIHLNDLQNLHTLIDQRITQQNSGKLIQLKTQVYYSDESSVILSSYDELVTYNEVKPIISEAVRMTWVYLIQFADKTVPEKQEIEILIISTPQRNVVEDDDLPMFFPSSGQIKMNIKHTARSWGSDIESLITNQINSILIKPNKYKEFIRKNSSNIGLITGILFFLSSILTIIFTTRLFIQSEINTTKKIIKNASNLDVKVDAILNYLAYNNQNSFSQISQLYLVICFIIAIFLGIWVSNLANNRTKSYLVLTREAKKNMEISMKKSKNKFILFFVSIGVSVITKIIAAFIFNWCGLK